MKIAMIASEAAPFAKTGGLADVIGTLSIALGRLGHEISVITPAYRSTLQGGFALRDSGIVITPSLAGATQATVCEASLGSGVAAYLVRADRYFDREFLYGTPAEDYPDNAERFSFFSRAALEILRRRPVDIVHCHDWQAAPATVFLRAQPERYPEVAGAGSVFTIHNQGFQGMFPRTAWPVLDLDPRFFTPAFLEFYGSINFLKGALIFADKITTVSPSYAEEILTAEQGFGLEGVLRERAGDLTGILNGIDDREWNPWTDRFLPCHYGENSLAVKADCKAALQRAVALPEKSLVPLVAMISRLTLQKGFDLIEKAFDSLLERDVQVVLLGSGEPRFENFFRAAAARHPDRLAVEIGFNESLAHRIEAGADLFLMPSLYEPCGLNQMFSQKYGTIPIVRAVGGLKDTVRDYDSAAGTGTGFVFAPYEAEALLSAVDRALAVFADKQAWAALQRRAMAMDFSWERSAKLYANLYRQISAQGELPTHP